MSGSTVVRSSCSKTFNCRFLEVFKELICLCTFSVRTLFQSEVFLTIGYYFSTLIYIQTSIKMESVLQNGFLVGIFLTVTYTATLTQGEIPGLNVFRLWTYNNLSLCYLEKVDFFSDFQVLLFPLLFSKSLNTMIMSATINPHPSTLQRNVTLVFSNVMVSFS